MLTNFAVRFSIRRQSCQYRRDYAWIIPTFPLPRQALQGLYAAVNPRIRFLSRQWMQKDSDMICCPCRYSAGSALPFLSTWLARWCARLCRFACKELEHEGFDAACLLQSEGFCVQPAHKELIEVLAMASGIAERRIIAVSSRKTVFSAMKDLGSLAQPKPVRSNLFASLAKNFL